MGQVYERTSQGGLTFLYAINAFFFLSSKPDDDEAAWSMVVKAKATEAANGRASATRYRLELMT